MNFGYLFAAYSVIFVVIFLYVLFLWRRQAALEQELTALEDRFRALTEKGGAPRAKVRKV
jgi:CcmD family protein